MARIDDLPNELLTRVIAILGEASAPYYRRKGLPGLLSLCRASKRFCELARPEIYKAAHFGNSYIISKFFKRSGITKLPIGTLRSIFIAPTEEDSFICLGQDWDDIDMVELVNAKHHAGQLVFEGDGQSEEEHEKQLREEIRNKYGNDDSGGGFLKAVKKHCTDVLYLEIYLCCRSGTIEDNNPDFYIPIFEGLNPKSVIYDSGFSPVAMDMAEQSSPEIKLSELLDSFSSYTRLTYLRMPFVNFDKLTKAHMDLLARLPIQYFRLDWPSYLTVTKIYTLLNTLSSLKRHGLVIACQPTALESEFGDGAGQVQEDFEEKNAGLRLRDIKHYLAKKKQTQLLEKLLWLVEDQQSDDEEQGSSGEEEDKPYQRDEIYALIRTEQLNA